MTINGEVRAHLINCVRDLHEWEVPPEKLEEFARVMARDESRTFVIVMRQSLENVQEAADLYDELNCPWWKRLLTQGVTA